MPTLGIQIAAALIVLCAAAVAAGFKMALLQRPTPQRSASEPAWLSAAIAIVASLLGLMTLWSISTATSMARQFPVSLLAIHSLGIAFGLAGCVLMFASLASLGRNFSGTSGTYPSHQLVTSGLYKYVRHPYYTATGFIILGLSLLLGSLALVCLGSVLLYLLSIRSRAEERELFKLFGDEYRKWEATTGSFLPRVRSRH